MDISSGQPDEGKSREAAWAKPVSKLRVPEIPAEALNLNVEGRQVAGALQGFGQMWQKTYWVRLSGATVTPAEVIQIWKEKFPQFWPKGNRFYGPMTGIAPGEVAVLNLAGPGGVTGPGGMPVISTGIMVIYADGESFTFMNPEGHMFAGWITFSAHEQEGSTVAQAQVLVRASDPLWELVMRLFGYKKEDEFWHYTLKSLATHFGVDGQVQMHATCVDPRLQWSQAKNVWHNAAVRTALYTAGSPLRWVRNLVRHSV